jgi:adenine-specific DNA-methyltransferase
MLFFGETDTIRKRVSRQLEPQRKSELGQFMTPSDLAEFMAGLFEAQQVPASLLDAGAGIGSLTVAAVRALGPIDLVHTWEIDPLIRTYLTQNLAVTGVPHSIHGEDFIESAVRRIALAKGERYTHAILNPPYKKLNSDSRHRALLRKVGIETVNLYTAFVALSIMLMRDGGQVVAIIPRSFCNGPYYRPFRLLLQSMCSLDRIHVFGSRNKAFKDDDVLQENVIIKAVRGKRQGNVIVSSSQDHKLTDYSETSLPFSEIIKPGDPESFIHVPTEEPIKHACDELLTASLNEIGVDVCTGPVVDFRLKEYWLADPTSNSVPLLYPHHFSGGRFQYPKPHKKPNALQDIEETQRWLMPNECYVLVKRFSAKEEKRRVVAYVFDPQELKAKRVGFENHWNVFHYRKRGIDPVLARGLACFLNSTALDKRFRVFSGHTQVNATDLRNLRYPSATSLRALGSKFRPDMNQHEIDIIVNE